MKSTGRQGRPPNCRPISLRGRGFAQQPSCILLTEINERLSNACHKYSATLRAGPPSFSNAPEQPRPVDPAARGFFDSNNSNSRRQGDQGFPLALEGPASLDNQTNFFMPFIYNSVRISTLLTLSLRDRGKGG